MLSGSALSSQLPLTRPRPLTPSCDRLSSMVGDHDFRNMCKIDAANVTNFRRVLKSFTLQPLRPTPMFASWQKDGPLGTRAAANAEMKGTDDPSAHPSEGSEEVWFAQIKGQAFLWHQVEPSPQRLYIQHRLSSPPTTRCYSSFQHPTPMPHSSHTRLVNRALASTLGSQYDGGSIHGWKGAGAAGAG
jgi:hypothetical protein